MTDETAAQTEITPLLVPSQWATDQQRLRHDLEPLRLAGCYIVVVTGSREWGNLEAVRGALHRVLASVQGLHHRVVLVHGQAGGLDRIAARLAKLMGFNVLGLPAPWREHGKAAGPLRNQAMLEIAQPHLVLGFPLPQSVGTWDCLHRAAQMGFTTELVRPEDGEE